jgi:hypothetical protein
VKKSVEEASISEGKQEKLLLPPPPSDQVAFAGVMEFTSPNHAAYLPYWMMKKLSIEEGDDIFLQSVKLARAKSIRLESLDSTWEDIPEKVRKGLLEFQLRSFASLSEGDQVTVDYNHKKYLLKVLSVESEQTENVEHQAVDITDADVMLDVVSAMNLDPLQLILEYEKPLKDTLKASQFKYYSVVLPESIFSVQFKVEPIKGDLELYISTSNPQPDQKDFDWVNQRSGTLLVNLDAKSEPDFARKYYIGIRAYKDDAEYSVIVSPPSNLEKGNSLLDSENKEGPNTKKCDNW